MLVVYLAMLGFGATMILASLALGGGDKDLGHDADHDGDGDADHDHDHDHADEVAWWLPLASMRFWTFGTAAFGLAGALLTFLAVPALITAIAAVVLGVGSGYGAARVFAALKSDEVSGATELGRLVGEEARVTVPIAAGGVGKVTVSIGGGREELRARSRVELPRGAAVLITGVDAGGVAEVERMPELDRPADEHQESDERRGLAQSRAAGQRTERT